MRSKKLAKLQYNIWFYFIVFALLLIVVVWISQILLFDRVYQRKKFNTITETGENLRSQLNTDDEITDDLLNSWLKTAVDASETGIFSYLAHYEGDKLVVETIYSGFIVSKDNTSKENETTVELTDEELVNDAINQLIDAESEYVRYQFKNGNDVEGSLYVYATKVKNSIIGDGFLVLRTSQQALVDTISIIQMQLIIVTVFIIIVAFFISYYISRRISKPIIEMSKLAKKWADGDESIVFTNDSYQELYELCETLNYSKEAISQTSVLQRDLLANVSHDLKTPLTMIKAYAEMIRDLSGDVKEKRDAHTNVIIAETDRLTMLVNDILDLSKLQNKMMQNELAILNFSKLCERVIYRFDEFVEQSGYKIIKEIEPDLYVSCDEKKIEQVIYNLVGNSINYTGNDKIIFVKVSLQDNLVLFESIDTGKGISKDNIGTIWEKYYRFSDTHQRPIKGTGLGLSIVKTILESHKVKFGVISKKDVGSNFFIQFNQVVIENEVTDNE